MRPQLEIWKRFIRSVLGVDRCGLSWGSGRGPSQSELTNRARYVYVYVCLSVNPIG